jgi:hypothetical protein
MGTGEGIPDRKYSLYFPGYKRAWIQGSESSDQNISDPCITSFPKGSLLCLYMLLRSPH